MKKAILFGASGFVGSYLLTTLLNDNDYAQLTVVVRRNLNIQHNKLKLLIGDYASLLALKAHIIADEIFIALGTTKKNTPDENEYYQVDHDYPVLASKIAKENGARSVFIVSAVGANPDSKFFYVRTKGETERDIIALNFEHTHIFRPSLIMGNRKEKRFLEKYLIKTWTVVNKILVGKQSKKYRGIDAKDIATAMIAAGKKERGKINIYYWQQMNDLLLS